MKRRKREEKGKTKIDEAERKNEGEMKSKSEIGELMKLKMGG